MKRTLLIVTAVMISMGSLTAQPYLITFSWNPGIPLGETRDFLADETISAAGVSFDYRHILSSQFTLGLYTSWDYFNGYSEDLLQIGNTDITGPQQYFLNMVPIMVNAHYYPGNSEKIRPYVGGGLGVISSAQRTSIGTFIIQNNNWHFGLYPEVGIILPLSDKVGISVGGKYNVAFKTSDSINHSYFSLNIGITGFLEEY